MTQGPQDYFDLVEVAIVSLDRDGTVRRINRRGCEILGYSRDEIVGRSWFRDFVPPRVRREVEAAFHKLLSGATKGVERFENPVLTRQGTERLIAWHNSFLKDATGRVVETLSAGEDVTERRVAAQELADSRREVEDIRHALDQSAIVAITDQGGAIRYVNDKFCEISGYSRDELLGQDHRIVNSGFHPKAFFRDLWRTIASGEIWRGEIRNRAKDGTFYWVDTTIVPFLDDRDRPYQYLAIRNDITPRKEAEQQLRRQESLAQIGRMAAQVAHEVKNPLAGISGALQIISGRLAADSGDRVILGEILKRIDALDGWVEELLTFSRPREPTFAPVDLPALVRDTVEILRRDARFARVRFEMRAAACTLPADQEQLRSVLLNLLINAAQAAGARGKVDVEVACDETEVRVTVSDDGPGIPEAIRGQVFEPFFSTKTRGSGLGLAVARRVVEAHRGRIAIDSPPGGGTSVRVHLPRERG